jgi:hypothetical protein
MTHDDAIEWPNGEGFTPCTRAYAAICDEMDAIKPDDVNMDDLSPEDYQRFNELLNQRDQMMLDGHLGKSVRY